MYLCEVYVVDCVPFQHINCSSFTVLMVNGLAQMIPQIDPDLITLIRHSLLSAHN